MASNHFCVVMNARPAAFGAKRTLAKGLGSSAKLRREENSGSAIIGIAVSPPLPNTLRINQRVMVDEEPIEFICNENQQFRRRVKID